MSDETPTTDPAPTPAAETPAPAPEAPVAPAPVAETPAPAPAAPADATAPTQPEIPAAAAAPTQPEIPVVAAAPAAGYAAPEAAAPVATAAAPAGSHVAVPKWVLATVAGVLGAAVMFGIGYAVGDGSSSDNNNAAIGAPFGQNGQTPFGNQGGTGNQNGGGTQQLPSFPGGNQGGTGNQNGGGTGNQNGGGTQQQPSFPGGNQGGTGTQGGGTSTSGAFLGVATQQVTNGLEVVQVVSGSAAADAGLQAGDVIVEFDGNRVTTPAQLANVVSNSRVGDEVEITYERNGSSKTVTVELGSRNTANSN